MLDQSFLGGDGFLHQVDERRDGHEGVVELLDGAGLRLDGVGRLAGGQRVGRGGHRAANVVGQAVEQRQDRLGVRIDGGRRGAGNARLRGRGGHRRVNLLFQRANLLGQRPLGGLDPSQVLALPRRVGHTDHRPAVGPNLALLLFQHLEELDQVQLLAVSLLVASFPHLLNMLDPKPGHFEVVSGVGMFGIDGEAVAQLARRFEQRRDAFLAHVLCGVFGMLAESGLCFGDGQASEIVMGGSGQPAIGGGGRGEKLLGRLLVFSLRGVAQPRSKAIRGSFGVDCPASANALLAALNLPPRKASMPSRTFSTAPVEAARACGGSAAGMPNATTIASTGTAAPNERPDRATAYGGISISAASNASPSARISDSGRDIACA